MANYNDLIGLSYKWGNRPGDGSGFTDCFGLAMEARVREGLTDRFPSFEWVYEQHSEEDVGIRKILRWLKQNCEESSYARNGSLLCFLTGKNRAALATVVKDDHCILLTSRGQVTLLPLAIVTRGKYYWTE